MKRTVFRNIWLVLILILGVSAWLLYQRANDMVAQIDRVEGNLLLLKRERNNVEQLSKSLEQLDRLTVDERYTTRLDLLRHLDLETANHEFIVRSPQAKEVGNTTLYIRDFTLKAIMPYADALALADQLHSNRKTVLSSYEVSAVLKNQERYGDWVNMKIDGAIYGLEKR